MNGNGKDIINKKEDSKISLVITMEKDKGILVEGPGNGEFYDEALCFHLMRKGGQFIDHHNAMASKSKIIKPGLGGRIKGAFGGKG